MRIIAAIVGYALIVGYAALVLDSAHWRAILIGLGLAFGIGLFYPEVDRLLHKKPVSRTGGHSGNERGSL